MFQTRPLVLRQRCFVELDAGALSFAIVDTFGQVGYERDKERDMFPDQTVGTSTLFCGV